jgi:hypothetical protein
MKRAKDVLVANDLWEKCQKQQAAGTRTLLSLTPGWTTEDFELYKEFLEFKIQSDSSEKFDAWCSRKKETVSIYFRPQALETLKSEYGVLSTKGTENEDGVHGGLALCPSQAGNPDPARMQELTEAPAWAQTLLKEVTAGKSDVKKMNRDLQVLSNDVHGIVHALTAMRKTQAMG